MLYNPLDNSRQTYVITSLENIMNIKACKVKLLRFLYQIKACWYRLRGIEVGKGTFISAFPWFYKVKGARIIIGNGVTLHSKRKYNTLITNAVSISAVEPGAVVELHENCGISGSKIICASRVSIGKNTMIGPDTTIYDCKEHEYSPEGGWSTIPKRFGKPIIIGDNCFIGTRCIILKGVTIGDNCVIAAGTIITKDVPAGHLAYGNPAIYSPLSVKNGGPGRAVHGGE